ncbi:MAG: protein-L-isoaspartate(D-aspartate) O-methyltransferase, partial [Pseudomonadota bacterium]|nr:protein-L-isoaspartate(D-aspartate) O-methyltransferase [Pseudomonadota bacterium]
VGLPYMRQDLLLLEKSSSGAITTRNLLPVAFVPLTGDHGAKDE